MSWLGWVLGVFRGRGVQIWGPIVEIPTAFATFDGFQAKFSVLVHFLVGWLWAHMAVWGAVGRTHGGPKPQLDLWGVPVATEMPPWAVVGLNGAHFA